MTHAQAARVSLHRQGQNFDQHADADNHRGFMSVCDSGKHGKLLSVMGGEGGRYTPAVARVGVSATHSRRFFSRVLS